MKHKSKQVKTPNSAAINKDILYRDAKELEKELVKEKRKHFKKINAAAKAKMYQMQKMNF